jgi:hypothetical protein
MFVVADNGGWNLGVLGDGSGPVGLGNGPGDLEVLAFGICQLTRRDRLGLDDLRIENLSQFPGSNWPS